MFEKRWSRAATGGGGAPIQEDSLLVSRRPAGRGLHVCRRLSFPFLGHYCSDEDAASREARLARTSSLEISTVQAAYALSRGCLGTLSAESGQKSLCEAETNGLRTHRVFDSASLTSHQSEAQNEEGGDVGTRMHFFL